MGFDHYIIDSFLFFVSRSGEILHNALGFWPAFPEILLICW